MKILRENGHCVSFEIKDSKSLTSSF